jgi:hypothetical protein
VNFKNPKLRCRHFKQKNKSASSSRQENHDLDLAIKPQKQMS